MQLDLMLVRQLDLDLEHQLGLDLVHRLGLGLEMGLEMQMEELDMFPRLGRHSRFDIVLQNNWHM